MLAGIQLWSMVSPTRMKVKTMNPVKSLRIRYLLALSALAVVITVMYLVVHSTIVRQENYGRVINIAANQVGLANRIAFFTSQMSSAASEDEFNMARHQLMRAIRLMRKQHDALLNGDPTRNIPRIMTPLLKNIYFDPGFGLSTGFNRFSKQAEKLYLTNFGKLTPNMAPFVYITTYGPFVLEPLLNAAVSEYEIFSRTEIQKLERLELVVLAAAIFLLLIEALFIFRPLERKLQTSFQELWTKRDELEEANRAKTDLLSNMSHELRTPLNAIIGFSECLTAGVYGPLASARQVESIDDIHQSGVHLLALVNDILDISAVEQGTIELHETNVPVTDLISSSISHLGLIPQRAGIALRQIHTDASFSLWADERRLRQVLINLLMNAVKFTPKGGNVYVTPLQFADGRAGFSVSDTGIGMTAAEIEIARERFGQAGDVMTRSYDGAGLGLPLVIKLASYHDGIVNIDSEKGVGTSVSVLFPPDRVIGVARLRQVAAA